MIFECPCPARPYYALRHLCNALWWNHDPRKSLVANLTAYFDASGKPDDPNVRYLFVSGFISTEHKWRRFEAPWRAFVEDCGMEYFRTSKFFAQWRDRPAERDALLLRGAKIVRQFTRQSFSCGLDLVAHRQYVATHAIPNGAEYPFALAGTIAIGRVLRYSGLDPDPR